MTLPGDPRLLWAERLPPRPLCDVPWFGNAIVMSDGTVNFCCHSNGVAGNVHEASFEEVWNGAVMREVRRELAAQRLPVLCQTTSCPIYRGDTRHFLVARGGNASTSSASISAEMRPMVTEWMRGTRLELRRQRRFLRQDRLALDLTIEYTGVHPFAADLLVGIATPGGAVRFAPLGTEAPIPLRQAIALGPATPRQRVTVDGVPTPTGPLEVCVALMIAAGNPLLVNQCVWSAVVRA